MSGIARSFAFVFLVSCGLNIAFLFALHLPKSPDQLDMDAREYFELAGHIADGTYHFDSRRIPGHPLILAALRKVTGSNLVTLQTLVTLFFCASAPLTYLLARRFVTNDKIALSAGLATVVWPPFIFYAHTLYSETTALPLFIGFLASLPRGLLLGQATAPNWRWLISGVLMALCMFVRPMYLVFLPFIPLILWFEDGRLMNVTRATALIGAGCFLTLTPWLVYSSCQAGTPILLSANMGETLAGGLNPTLLEETNQKTYQCPDGRMTWGGPGKWISEDHTQFLSKNELALPRPERDRLLKKHVFDWILANPGGALLLERSKLAYMWGIYPFWSGFLQTFFGNIPILILMTVGALSLFSFRKHLSQLSMLITLPFFSSAVALISWGSWRFRQPADVGLIILLIFFIWSRIPSLKIQFRGTSGTEVV